MRRRIAMKYRPGTNVLVRVGAADVEVVAGDFDSVEVILDAKGFKAMWSASHVKLRLVQIPKEAVVVEADLPPEVKVTVHLPKVEYTTRVANQDPQCPIFVNIAEPAHRNLHIETRGSITMDGPVGVADLRAGGDIKATHVTAGRLCTTGGSITAGTMTGDATLETEGGEVTAHQIGPGLVYVHTRGGKAEISTVVTPEHFILFSDTPENLTFHQR